MSGRNQDDGFAERWEELAAELEGELPHDLLEWPDQAEGFGSHVVWEAADDREGAADDAPAGEAAPAGPRDWVAPPEDEGHFVPPEPPPVFSGQPLVIFAWILVGGGLAALFYWAARFEALSPWIGRGGIIALVAGLALLVWRLPKSRTPAPGEDDSGAQV
ncbi:MAG: hypothetical protein LBR27_00490 [Bifidobacteriaceae bacterium]|nr:hypothetical protein [Bifidobacteriaceae bacterium]